MKKILAVCGLTAALLGASSCSNSGSTGAADQGFADSLSTYLGATNGMRLASEYNTIPEDQKQALRSGISCGQSTCCQRTVYSACRTGLGLHLGDLNRMTEDVGSSVSRPLIGSFRHG